MARVQPTPTMAEKKFWISGDVKIKLRILSAQRRASSRIIILPWLRAEGILTSRGISRRAGDDGDDTYMI